MVKPMVNPLRYECFSVASEIKCYGDARDKCFSVANETKYYGEASQIQVF